MAIKSKKVKVDARTKSKFRLRKRISGSDARPRLSVFKSSKHTYAQLISDETGKTLASASTLEEEVLTTAKGLEGDGLEGRSRSTKSVTAARAVGIVLAKRAKNVVGKVVFDRNGFVFWGRLRAVADGARDGGLEF